MKRSILLIILVLVLTAALILLSSFLFKALKTDEDLIADRIDSFLKAYNSGDMNKVFENLDSKTRNTYGALLNVGNMLIGKTGYGVSLSDIFSISVGFISEDDILTVSDLKITIESETKATAKCVLSYSDKLTSKKEEAVFKLIKEDKDWFIRDLTGF